MAATAPDTYDKDRLKWSHTLPPFWKGVITQYLKDDAPTFDVGGFVVGGAAACWR